MLNAIRSAAAAAAGILIAGLVLAPVPATAAPATVPVVVDCTTATVEVLANPGDTVVFSLDGECENFSNFVYQGRAIEAGFFEYAGSSSTSTDPLYPELYANGYYSTGTTPKDWYVYNDTNHYPTQFDWTLSASLLTTSGGSRTLVAGIPLANVYGSTIGDVTITYGGPRSDASPSTGSRQVPQFGLVLDAQGGACSSSVPTVDEGTWVQLPAADACSRPGHVLVGWLARQTDGPPAILFAPSAWTLMSGDNTLFAVWRQAA